MNSKLLLVLVIYAATHGGSLFGNEPTADYIDKLVQKKWSETWLGHHYSDARVRKMSKLLPTVSFPATDGSVARTLGISDPQFFVQRRACGFSLIPEFPSTTLTYENCRLNKDYELIVVRETSFLSSGITESKEQSAEIRRVGNSK